MFGGGPDNKRWVIIAPTALAVLMSLANPESGAWAVS